MMGLEAKAPKTPKYSNVFGALTPKIGIEPKNFEVQEIW